MAVSARRWLQCLQQVLRAGGYAVRVNGLWDAPTRRSWWQRAYGDAALPAVGAGTLWMQTAAVSMREQIVACLGGIQADYVAGLQEVVNLAADVEAGGRLEGEAAEPGIPWAWVAAGGAVILVGVVSIWLWRQGRRKPKELGR